MNCNDIKRKLALLIGNDLEDVHASAVRRHLSECPDCRETRRQLDDSHSVLRAVRGIAKQESGNSLWPRINAQLPQVTLQPPERSPLGWLPTATLAAACLAVLVFAGSTPLLKVQDQPIFGNHHSFDILNDLSPESGGFHPGFQDGNNGQWPANPIAVSNELVFPPVRESATEPLLYRYDDM